MLRGETIIHIRQKWTSSASQVWMVCTSLLEEIHEKAVASNYLISYVAGVIGRKEWIESALAFSRSFGLVFCIHTYIQTYTRARTYLFESMFWIHAHMLTYISDNYTHIYTYTNTLHTYKKPTYMHTCLHIYLTATHKHKYIYIYIYIYIYTNTLHTYKKPTNMHTCLHICWRTTSPSTLPSKAMMPFFYITCACMYVCMYMRMYVCMCLCMCVCMYVSMCVCMYVRMRAFFLKVFPPQIRSSDSHIDQFRVWHSFRAVSAAILNAPKKQKEGEGHRKA